MSGNTWISVGVGVLAAAATVFTFGFGAAALWAFSAGMLVTSLILGPDKQKTGGSLRPDEMQINNSSEDATVPVVFGTTRVPGNFIYCDFDSFKSTAIYAQAEGGKGGSEPPPQQTGWTYNVPLAYGICMGPIDALYRVLGSPGLDVMYRASMDNGLRFPTGVDEAIQILWTKTQGDQTATEGGYCNFFPGSANQGMPGGELGHGYYRYVCWVNFGDYEMTNSTAPRSLLYEIERMPKVVDDDGDALELFPVRAAVDDTFPEWKDANPAAVAWEIMQNPIWGKGMSTEQLNEDDFRTAALYYRDKRLGLSTAMGQGNLSEFMDRLRDIFGLWSWWDGTQQRCRCLWDRSTAYAPRIRISAEDIVGSPQFSRPSLSATYNEIRLEFTNRENNWQAEVATAMDLAHVETVKGIRTQTVDAAEIGNRRAAELIAHTLLRQIAYPSAACQVQLRRTYSGLQPGSFVEMLWDEWRDSGVATTFWRVVDISDDDQASEGLTITLMEDLYATAVDGEVGDGDFTAPVPTIDTDDPLENSDLVEDDLTADRPPGSMRPVVLWEPNAWATNMSRAILVAPTREKNYIQSLSLAWRKLGETATSSLNLSLAMPLNGKLLDVIPGTGPLLDRATTFRVQMYYDKDVRPFESATGLVQNNADHFSSLTSKLDAMMLIGNEIFRVGFADDIGGGILTVKNFMRAELGSVLGAHAVNDTVVFFPRFNPKILFTPAGSVPTTQKVEIRLTNNSINSLLNPDVDATDYAPQSGLGILFPGTSVTPFAPELKASSRVTNTWTLKIRPRTWGGGAAWRNDIQDDLTTYVTDLPGMQLQFQKGSGGPVVTLPAATSFTTPPFAMPAGISVDSLLWTPDDGSVNGGLITVVVTFDANPAALNISAVRDGYASATPLAIPTP